MMESTIQKLGESKKEIMDFAMANQSPSTMTMARQSLDALDTAYLFLSSLVAHVSTLGERVDEAVAGSQFAENPAAEAPDA